MHNEIFYMIGDMAVEALKLEAAATPKPGLVDRANNGAHQDMDYGMFLRSSESLRNCFRNCAKAGANHEELRQAGITGEQCMYAATNHVNTHKGLVFSMGILCGALGALAGADDDFDEKDVQKLCAEIAKKLLERDEAENTHGLKVLVQTGIKGVRGEALSGFESAFGIGLLTLREAVGDSYSFEQAMVKALLALMAHTEDSNLVHRGGEKGLQFVREHSAAMLTHVDLRREEDMEMVKAFDEICIEKNLSPGGSADLLALSAMLYLFFERKEG